MEPRADPRAIGSQGATVGGRAGAQWYPESGARERDHRSLAERVFARWSAVLRVVREVVGAPDYERYLEHHARCHAGTEPLDRRAYYAEFVTRRFGPGPTRCC